LTIPNSSGTESRVGFFLDRVDDGVSKAFKQLHWETLKDGCLSKKDKLIIAVASAVAAKCEICVKALTAEALKHGGTIEELTEAVSVASLVCAGSGFNYASLIFDCVKENEKNEQNNNM
jgi:AhpD family alkylhydroperoxidase